MKAAHFAFDSGPLHNHYLLRKVGGSLVNNRNLRLYCVYFVVCLLFAGNCAHGAHKTVKEITEKCSKNLLELESTLPNGKKVISTAISLTPGGLFLTTGAFINAKYAKVRTIREKASVIDGGEWSFAKPIHFEIYGVIALGKVYLNETPTLKLVSQVPLLPAPGKRVYVVSFKGKKSKQCLVSRNVIGKRCMPFAEAGGKAQDIFKFIPVYKLLRKIDPKCYGGLVIDSDGNPLGMASAILGDGKTCDFVVPMAVLRAYMMAVNSPELKKIHRSILPLFDEVHKEESKKLKIPPQLQRELKATAELFMRRTIAGKKQCLKWQEIRDVRLGIAPKDEKKRAERKKAIATLLKKHPQWPYEVAQCVHDKVLVTGMTEKQALLLGKLMEESNEHLKVINPGGDYILFAQVKDGIIFNAARKSVSGYFWWSKSRADMIKHWKLMGYQVYEK